MPRLFLNPIVTVFCIVILADSWVPAQTLSEQIVTDVASPMVQNEIVRGMSIGYLQNDSWGIVHLGSAKPSGQRADNSTLYELGSISKIFTSTLLADAVIRGDIELESKAHADNAAGIRLPSLEGRAITWRDLSTHRSGLPRLPANLRSLSLKDPYRDYDSAKAAEFLTDFQLPRKPGAEHEYSNFAVSVLGYLVAQSAGKTYQELLRERIAQPLGMSDCTVDLTDEQKKRFAIPYSDFDSPTLAWSFADMPGAGGVRASLRDMMRFAKAQLNPPEGTLGQAIELAWTKQSEADASGPATGLGWMIADDGQTHWQNGGTGGSRCAIFVNRRIQTAVVILCNTSVDRELERVAEYLMQVADGTADPTKPMSSAAGSDRDEEPAKVSPFTSVGLNHEKIFVQYDGRILQWMEIDGIPVAGIVASAKKQFGNQWGKRIREDLVEVLWGMDHRPGVTVALRMRDIKTNEEVVVPQAKMTTSNRHAIRAESKALAGNPVVGDFDESSMIGPNSKQPATIDAKHRARLAGRYQLAPNFIFDVKDHAGRLMVGITNQATQEVFPDSPIRWSYRGVNATLEFKLDASGPAKSLVLHQNGVEQTAKRIK